MSEKTSLIFPAIIMIAGWAVVQEPDFVGWLKLNSEIVLQKPLSVW